MTADDAPEPNAEGTRPLDGLRVLEVGQAIAGPFAGTLLAYFGAEVVKVEPPGKGDPARTWRGMDEGTSLLWRTLARNKKCITLDLRRGEGRALCRRLAARADVLVENFRPGTMEKWGLGPDTLRQDHAGLVYVRVSGFGQTGPYAHRAGYAAVCEAVGGLRHLIGHPGEPPVRPNLSLGDSLGGIHAVLGTLLALAARARSGRGQVVDVALYESVFSVLESVVPEHDRLGLVRGPSGTTITGIAPSNVYPCADGRWVVIGGNGDSVFARLMEAVGRPDLRDDPRFSTNAGRAEGSAELDAAIVDFTGARDADAVVATLEAVAVPAGRVYDAADMAADPHFTARGLFERVDVGGRPLALPAMAPRLTETPGRTDWAGPDIGAHNREVLGGWLGLSDADLARLERAA